MLVNGLNFKRTIAFFAIVFFIFILPLSANGALVNCELGQSGKECNFCELFDLIGRIITFIFTQIILPLTVVAFLMSGLFYLFGGGSPDKIKKANGIIRVTIYGILIAYSSWLIINTLLHQLLPDSAKQSGGSGYIFWPWNERPECELGPPPEPVIIIRGQGINRDGTITQYPDDVFSTHTEGAVFLSEAGITTKSSGNCSDRANSKCTSLEGLPKDVAVKLTQIKSDCGNCNITITGGTETGHLSHGVGKPVVDISWRDLSNDGRNFILTHKNDYGIKRILCPAFADPTAGCDGYEISGEAHLHIEF